VSNTTVSEDVNTNTGKGNDIIGLFNVWSTLSIKITTDLGADRVRLERASSPAAAPFDPHFPFCGASRGKS
jgi:hypothetical protein